MSIKYFLEHLEEIKDMELEVDLIYRYTTTERNTIIWLSRFVYFYQTKLSLDAPTTMAFDSFNELYIRLKKKKELVVWKKDLERSKDIFYYPKEKLLKWIEEIGTGILFHKR